MATLKATVKSKRKEWMVNDKGLSRNKNVNEQSHHS